MIENTDLEPDKTAMRTYRFEATYKNDYNNEIRAL